jgi:hypothetical protein
LEGERYVALSRLGASNGAGEGELPRTFLGAVQVTRAMRMRYLWVDAVCIIREDAINREREAESMEEVFSSAYYPFAADSAADWR